MAFPFFSEPRRKGATESARDPAPAPRTTDGMRIYAIGDIHGRADLLEICAQQIAGELRECPGEALTVALGDMIDRGPDSAGVLGRLRRQEFPTPVIALRGNHEQVMLDALESADVFEQWMMFGGMATLASYGLDPCAKFAATRLALRERATEDLDFLAGLPLTHVCGDYLFCHAGVRPGVALEAQRPADLMTIRQDFLGSTRWHGKYVVHGHTPCAAPEILPNRAGLDTGAYATGRLTCAAIEGDRIRLVGASVSGLAL